MMGESEITTVEVDGVEVMDLGRPQRGALEDRMLEDARGVAGSQFELQLDLAISFHGSCPFIGALRTLSRLG